MDVQSSAILSKIHEIRDSHESSHTVTKSYGVLHNHEIYYDDVKREICIEAEVRPNCLKKGARPTQLCYAALAREGVFPGDEIVQIISRRLGGPGHNFNAIPLNGKLDLSTWKADEEVVYNHLKKGTNTARMLFALEYDDESKYEFCRPIKLFYHFALYDENKKFVGENMEGIFHNLSPTKK